MGRAPCGQLLGCLLRSCCWDSSGAVCLGCLLVGGAAWGPRRRADERVGALLSRCRARFRRGDLPQVFGFSSVLQATSARGRPLTCAFARASPRGRGTHTPSPRPGRTTCARGPVARGPWGAATSPSTEPRRKKRLRRANWKEPQHLCSQTPCGLDGVSSPSEKSMPTSGVFISDASRCMCAVVTVGNRAPKLGMCNDC